MDEGMARLVSFSLNPTFFSFNGVIYDHSIVKEMGSPLSPVLAILFTEHFGERALYSIPLKPKWCEMFVDDTNLHCEHGRDNLKDLQSHISSSVDGIKLIKEIEKGSLLVLESYSPITSMAF
ncbi:hypothetical protein KI387_007126, partial [Taxus chinensis]